MARKKTHCVRRGRLMGEGDTKTEAKADLERQIDWALQVDGPIVEMRFGWVLIIAATPNGWETKVFNPADTPQGKPTGFSTYHGTSPSYADIQQSVRMHAAQNAWQHGVNDEDHIAAAGLNETRAAELRRWIGFQRRYFAERCAGKSDAEAFNIAIGLAA